MESILIVTVILVGVFVLLPVLLRRRNAARDGHRHGGKGTGGCCH